MDTHASKQSTLSGRRNARHRCEDGLSRSITRSQSERRYAQQGRVVTPRRPDAGNRGGPNNMETKKEMDADRLDEFHNGRKAAAANIDIETCEIRRLYVPEFDPYLRGLSEDLATRIDLSKDLFLRSPDSGGWSGNAIFPRPKPRRCTLASNAKE